MSDAADWEPYPLPPIGVSIERYVPWPAALAELRHGANFYQRIPDTDGLVFLRYGPEETADTFLATLADGSRTYEIVADRPVEVLGEPARKLTIIQQRAEMGFYRSETPEALPIHAISPAASIHIEVIAFAANLIPVLVGFRIDVERLAEHRARIDHSVGSVSWLSGPAGATD